jgi:REP element-mobilizing transposase RayT
MSRAKHFTRGVSRWHSKRTKGISWITFNTAQNLILTHEQRRSIYDVILEGNGVFYRVIAFVVMDNHVHLLIELNGTSTSSRIVSAIKGRTSKHFVKHHGLTPPVWQASWYEMEVLGPGMLQQKIGYVLKNAHEVSGNGETNMAYCYVQPLVRTSP